MHGQQNTKYDFNKKRMVQKRRPVAEGVELFAGSEIGNTVGLMLHLLKKAQ
jgi:hypothetical protein